MGGYGSGRRSGRPTADASRKLDLAWMMRGGFAQDGKLLDGILRWTCRGQPSGSISYLADMREPGLERLKLSFTRGSGSEAESVEQLIPLTFTRPNYGGKRWWMICPYKGRRVGKLYLPDGGDRFASRKAWRLGYHSQRVAKRDQPFERLFRLQEKLGCPTGFERPILKPKGMWQRTFERHLAEYRLLDEICSREFSVMMRKIG